MKKILLPVPYIEQGPRSVNCGPCALKMLLDYYGFMGRAGKPYSLRTLARELAMSRAWGCQESDIEAFLTKKHISYELINPGRILSSLKNKDPLLVSFKDELHDGHFAIVHGFKQISSKKTWLFFQDSWPDFGANFPRLMHEFREQLAPFGNWVLRIKT